MKKYPLVLLMPFFLFSAVEAHAQEWCEEDLCCASELNFYAKFSSGPNFLQSTTTNKNHTSYQTGYIIAGSIGYIACYGLRPEAEYAFRRNDIRKIDFFVEGFSDHGHFQTSSYMGNLLWDVPPSWFNCAFENLRSFIGAGIGYDVQQMHSSNSRIIFNQKWRHFSWQLMAGLACPIFCNTEVSMEYRFHQGSRPFYNHSIGFGLSYTFGF